MKSPPCKAIFSLFCTFQKSFKVSKNGSYKNFTIKLAPFIHVNNIFKNNFFFNNSFFKQY